MSRVELVDLRKRVRKLIDQREHYAIRFAIRDEFSRSGRDDSSYGAIIDYVHEWNSSSFELNVSLRERPCLKVQRLGLKEELYFKYCNFKPFEIPCIEVVSRYGEGSLCNFSVNVHLKHMQSHEPVNGTGLEIPSMD